MTYEEIMERSAQLLNDYSQTLYTNVVLLPYLNISLSELEEIFELNNIPVTNESSALITVPIGISTIGFNSIPSLPQDLVEIQRLYESVTSQNIWVPVGRREFLTSVVVDALQRTNFGIWSWMDQEIHVLPAIVAIDLKLDYIKSLFSELAIGAIGIQNRVVNTDSFLYYRIAGLAAEFLGENPTRAASLNANADSRLTNSLGISIKGKQSIQTRRLPFRAAFKRRRMLF